MNTKLQIAFFVLAGISIMVGAFWAIITERRLKRFFLGKKAKDLEETITELGVNIKKLESAAEKIQAQISSHEARIKKSIRGVETIRFNPFPDQGGNQSFAIGMVNEEGDGLILSSMYGRERMSVFAKPVKSGKSAYELTAEEKEALDKARV
jgi:hypothetical protein